MSDLLFRICSGLTRMWFSAIQRSRFRHLGENSLLYRPFRIDGCDGISMGDNSVLQRGSWLYCVGTDAVPASLEIGNGCVFGYNNHITAVRSVCIGNHVLTANNVYISDNSHAYEDITQPIMHQPVIFKSPVRIGDGSWLGENVAVLGASIGRNCVIGANAVVTTDIPDYSVAVGVPARVIRRYDIHSHRWEAVHDTAVK